MPARVILCRRPRQPTSAQGLCSHHAHRVRVAATTGSSSGCIRRLALQSYRGLTLARQRWRCGLHLCRRSGSCAPKSREALTTGVRLLARIGSSRASRKDRLGLVSGDDDGELRVPYSPLTRFWGCLPPGLGAVRTRYSHFRSEGLIATVRTPLRPALVVFPAPRSPWRHGSHRAKKPDSQRCPRRLPTQP